MGWGTGFNAGSMVAANSEKVALRYYVICTSFIPGFPEPPLLYQYPHTSVSLAHFYFNPIQSRQEARRLLLRLLYSAVPSTFRTENLPLPSPKQPREVPGIRIYLSITPKERRYSGSRELHCRFGGTSFGCIRAISTGSKSTGTYFYDSPIATKLKAIREAL